MRVGAWGRAKVGTESRAGILKKRKEKTIEREARRPSPFTARDDERERERSNKKKRIFFLFFPLSGNQFKLFN